MQSVLQSVFALHDFKNVAIAPQGDAVAWQESFHPGGLVYPKMQTVLMAAGIGSTPIVVTAGDGQSCFD